jgi:hypothetical protein
MKNKLTLFGVIAAAHFLLFWTILGVLHFSGYQLFGFFAPPPNPPALDFLFSLLGVLSFPLGLLSSATPSTYWFVATAIAILLINSSIWGVALGSLFCAVKRLV